MIVQEASYEPPTPPSTRRSWRRGQRRRCPCRGDSEIRGTIDPQGLRHRLEAAHFMTNVSTSLGSVIPPAVEKAVGLVSAGYLKSPPTRNGTTRPMKKWRAWMAEFYP